MNILVTGGAGYIGSHTCVELLNSGYDIVVVDNLDNSCIKSIEAVKKLTGKDFKFYEYDLLDKENLEKVFVENRGNIIIAVMADEKSAKKIIENFRNLQNK